jgi:hypothetical protein
MICRRCKQPIDFRQAKVQNAVGVPHPRLLAIHQRDVRAETPTVNDSGISKGYRYQLRRELEDECRYGEVD